ncbi:MAG: restriction endonuclease subunit S [Saprospiraceae bacterium]|nr:restriction endonuclease subunit S [Saprospiraceae bacterium]MBK9630994.1 restriction endonuclease subunit S [Saprospiraceae bacterium]
MKWEYKSLNELGFVGRGKSRHRPRNAEHLYGGIYPFIQTGDIQKANFYIKEYSHTYSEEGLAQSKLWKEGTMVISIVGANTAETAILGFDACFPDSVIGFIPFENISDVRYIKYNLECLKVHLKGISEGTARENLSLEKLLSVKLPTPPFATQGKIASILSAYDDLIENNLKRIKLLEEAVEIVYKGEFNFFKPSNGVNKLPEDWKVHRADEIFRINIGKTPPREQDEWFNDVDSGVKWVSIKDINNSTVYMLNTSETVTENAVNKFNMNVAKIDTVILSFKLTVGKVAITTEEMVTNEAIAHFNIDDESRMISEYIYFYLKNFPYDSLGSTSSIGTAINSKIVKAMPVLLPPKSVIQEFGQKAKPSFQMIKTLLKQNSKLREARDILLPKLINGQIAVY